MMMVYVHCALVFFLNKYFKYLNFKFFFQFCDVAELVIILKTTQPDFATNLKRVLSFGVVN
jgi:hypothetical protein